MSAGCLNSGMVAPQHKRHAVRQTVMELIIILGNDPREQRDLEPLLTKIGQLSVDSHGRLILKIAHFVPDAVRTDKMEDLDSVRCTVDTILRAINGALEIESSPIRRIQIAEWRYVDTAGTERVIPPSAPTNLSIAIVNDQISPSLTAYARAAVHDPAARKALDFFMPYGDWSSLYKAYEVVRDDVGGANKIEEHGWASKDAQGLFRRTANSYDVLGAKARHGVQDKPPPAVPLSYGEARQFVRDIVKRWLDEIVAARTTP